MASKVLWLVINLSFECNKECSFCYLQGVDKITKVMSNIELDAIVKAYSNHIERYGVSRHNVFDIVGGEPLIHKDLVKELFNRIYDITPDIIFGISTNGLLLDKDFVKWSKEKRVHIAVSANDTPALELEKSLKLISRHRKGSRKLHIALTKYNLKRIDELLDVCKRTHTAPRLRTEYGIATDKDHIELYDNIMPRIIRKIIDENYLFYPQYSFELFNLLWTKKMDHICGRYLAVIDPNLDVRICPAQNHIIGNLKEPDFDFYKAIQKSDHLRFGYEGIPECEACQYRDNCGSACPLVKKLAGLQSNSPSPLCNTFKKLFPMLYELKDKWIQKNKSIRW